MTAELEHDRRRLRGSVQDRRTLPPPVELDDTVTSIDARPVPEPEAGRNLDQHRALQDG